MTVSSPILEVRYRPLGDSESAWITRSFADGDDVVIDELVRGVNYEFGLRTVASSGASSEWISAPASVPDSNRVGAAALPNIGNKQSFWDLQTSVTFTATSSPEGNSTATISVTSGDLVIGSQLVSYGASSGTITGSSGDKITVYLYYDDPLLTGGTRPLGITTNIVDSANVNGRVAISSLEITFPAAVGSNTGGGGIGGGGGSGGANNRPRQQEL